MCTLPFWPWNEPLLWKGHKICIDIPTKANPIHWSNYFIVKSSVALRQVPYGETMINDCIYNQ